MPNVTLPEKVYGPLRSAIFERFLLSLCKGLEVELKILGKTNRGWIRANVYGKDEDVAVRLLEQKIGLMPSSIDFLKKFSLLRGKILSSQVDEDVLRVDVGIFSPRIIDALISLETLQSQIADGRRLSLTELTELFCLRNNMPLLIKNIDDRNLKTDHFQAMLSEAQLSRFTEWIRSYLDRLMVFGASSQDVENAIKRSRQARDVVGVESLGLLEQSIICKLGTEAKGLLPKLGPMLPHAILKPFSPRKIKQYIKRPFL